MVTKYVVGTEGVLFITARISSYAGAVPLIYCHHATGTALTPVDALNETDTQIGEICRRMAYSFPVVSADLGGANRWGADPAPARVDAALAALAAETGCRTDRVLLLGDSMGAITALNWARNNLAKVAAVACLIPVVNLQQVHDSGPAPIPTDIETAYGSLSAYNSARDSHNPAANAAAYAGLPISLWYCDDDPTALAAQVASFAAATGAATHSMGSGGHAIPATLDPHDVTRFLAGNR